MSNATLIDLTEDRLDEAVDCQVIAFFDDPIFDYFFPDVIDRRKKMKVIFESGCRIRFITGEPLMALELDGNIVGVANVKSPDLIEETEEIKNFWKAIGEALGTDADDRFEAYQALKKKHTPQSPHHYLVSLSIKPGHQGMGLGGQLLEAVCQLAEDHPLSEATVLDTGTDINLKFYDKHRFKRIGEGTLGGYPSYWLKRNCGE